MQGKNTDISEMARQLAARRQQVEGVCAVCGRPFIGTKKRKYCGRKACEMAAYRARKRGSQG